MNKLYRRNMTDEHCIDCGLHVFDCECCNECGAVNGVGCDCNEIEVDAEDGYTSDMGD